MALGLPPKREQAAAWPNSWTISDRKNKPYAARNSEPGAGARPATIARPAMDAATASSATATTGWKRWATTRATGATYASGITGTASQKPDGAGAGRSSIDRTRSSSCRYASSTSGTDTG